MTNTSVSFVCYCCPFLFDGMARLMKQNRPNMGHKKTTVSGTYFRYSTCFTTEQSTVKAPLFYHPGCTYTFEGGGGGGGVFNLAKMVDGEFG